MVRPGFVRWMRHFVVDRSFWSIAACLALSSVVFGAGTFVFGPQTYTRAAGKPVAVKKKFTVKKPSGTYTLHVVNHGVTSAVIELNGRTIFEPDDFTIHKGGHGGDGKDRDGKDQDDKDRDGDDRDGKDRDDKQDKDGKDRDDRDDTPVASLARRVPLQNGTNEIVVELRSKPGT